jgi:hypothetical protein
MTPGEKRVRLYRATSLEKPLNFFNRGKAAHFGRETGIRTPDNDPAKRYKYRGSSSGNTGKTLLPNISNKNREDERAKKEAA